MATIRDLLVRVGVDADTQQLDKFDRGISDVKHGVIALAGALTTAGLGIRKLVMAGAEAEKTQIAFKTMLGSAEQAAQLLKDVRGLSLETPFKFEESEETVKMMLAMGSSIDTVIDETRMLGDVSSGLNVPMSRLALNFGQVRSMGLLTGRELRDFAVAGVPILEVLADQMGKTKNEVKEMVTAGQISFDMVKDAFRAMTSEGGKFENLMKKTSKTTGGLISNFGVLFDLTIRDLGKELNKGFFNDFLWNLFEWAKRNDNLKNTIEAVTAAALGLAGALALWGIGKVVMGIAAMITAVSTLGNVALLTQAKMLLIPILVGAATLGLILIIEDLWTTLMNPDADTYFRDLLNYFENEFPKSFRFLKNAWNLVWGSMFRTAEQVVYGITLLFAKLTGNEELENFTLGKLKQSDKSWSATLRDVGLASSPPSQPGAQQTSNITDARQSVNVNVEVNNPSSSVDVESAVTNTISKEIRKLQMLRGY